MGAERKSQFIDEKSRLATAYHEVREALSVVIFSHLYPLAGWTCSCCPLHGWSNAPP